MSTTQPKKKSENTLEILGEEPIESEYWKADRNNQRTATEKKTYGVDPEKQQLSSEQEFPSKL